MIKYIGDQHSFCFVGCVFTLNVRFGCTRISQICRMSYLVIVCTSLTVFSFVTHTDLVART